MTMLRALPPLLLLCGVTYVAGTSNVAFYTRGEPREALVAREMLRTGRWLVPTRPDGVPAKKPALYYWAAASSLAAMPATPERAVRLPSAFFATLGVVATWVATATVAGPRAAWLAALMLATTFEWVRSATSARVDMALAAGLTLVFAAWIARLGDRGSGWIALAAFGFAAATLAKGPVALVLPVGIAVAYALRTRDPGVVRRLGLMPAVVFGTAVAGLWYLAAWQRHGAAFLDVVFSENIARFVDTEDAGTGHAHGLVYLPLLGLVGWLPWAPLVPFVIAGARRAQAACRFADLWVLLVLVFFSIAAAKRSVYLLPMYPGLALLMAAGIDAAPESRAARLAAFLYVPSLIVLGGVTLAVATGVNVVGWIQPWLKAEDAVGASAVTAAVQGSWAVVAVALVTLASTVWIDRARRHGAWSTLIGTIALLTAAWVVVFDTRIHPAIARTRSPKAFMTQVAGIVSTQERLYVRAPIDQAVRFYASMSVVPWPRAGLPETAWALLDERDLAGLGLQAVATSPARHARRGAPVLVRAPAGTKLPNTTASD